MRQLACVLICTFMFAESVSLVDFVVVGTARRTGAANVGTSVVSTNVCWITVSDAATLYEAYLEKGMFGSCPVVSINASIRGGVSKNQKYLILQFPRDKGKPKQETYKISSMSSVGAKQ